MNRVSKRVKLRALASIETMTLAREFFSPKSFTCSFQRLFLASKSSLKSLNNLNLLWFLIYELLAIELFVESVGQIIRSVCCAMTEIAIEQIKQNANANASLCRCISSWRAIVSFFLIWLQFVTSSSSFGSVERPFSNVICSFEGHCSSTLQILPLIFPTGYCFNVYVTIS